MQLSPALRRKSQRDGLIDFSVVYISNTFILVVPTKTELLDWISISLTNTRSAQLRPVD